MNDIRRSNALNLLLTRLSIRFPIGWEEAQALLDLPGDTVSIKAHLDFVRAGERIYHTCLVEEGLLARFEQLEDGRRQIVSFHVPGDLVDLHSLLLSNAPSPLQTVCPSTIIRIPHAALRNLLARWPNLATAFWRDTIIDANTLAQSVVRLGRRDAYARVAHLLCEMATRYDHIGYLKNSSFRFSITQEQLADALGLTPVHINRTLRTLREDKLVVFASNRVEIQDWSGLQQAAAFDPSYLCVMRPSQSTGLVA